MSKLDIIRAWKDKAYRNTLTPEQQALLPEHPAGQVELNGQELEQVVGAQTESMWTVGCCPTGHESGMPGSCYTCVAGGPLPC